MKNFIFLCKIIVQTPQQLDLTNFKLYKTGSPFSLLRIGTAPVYTSISKVHLDLFFFALSISCKYNPMNIKMHFNKIIKISNWSQKLMHDFSVFFSTAVAQQRLNLVNNSSWFFKKKKLLKASYIHINCPAVPFHFCVLPFEQRLQLWQELFENAFPESSKLNNSTYKKLLFLPLFLFEVQVILLRNKGTAVS